MKSGVDSTGVSAGWVFDVRRFGAAGNGRALDTKPFQSAIDSCHAAGGGMVFCPPGNYLIGSIELKSNVELHVASCARLKASTKQSDYRAFDFGRRKTAHLIFSRNSSNIAITGQGVIDGSGSSFFEKVPGKQRMRVRDWRPLHMLAFLRCSNIIIRDIRLDDAPCYSIWPLGCDCVRIQGVKIASNRWGPNTDGIDPDCCRNVFISDCSIDCGDDCIALKSDTWNLGRPAACENVTVTNCVLRTTCCGIRIGYEGDGPIRNCAFSNIVMPDTRTGVNMLVPGKVKVGAFQILHGPAIENINFSNLILDTKIAFYFWIGDESEKPGGISNVSIADVTAQTEDGCYVGGAVKNRIDGLRMRNINLAVKGQLRPSFGTDVPYPVSVWGSWPARGIPYA
ncbi:MAG: glycosyl hydrolase family 28 protein, partial [Kiritimatiellia bacterium]